MSVRAIIFDLDGLMVDSEPLAKQSWHALLGQYGRVLDEEAMNEIFGLRPVDSAQVIHQRLGLPGTPEQILTQRRQLMWEIIQDKGMRPMPGLHVLLKAIDARGLPRAVATSSGRQYAPMAMRSIGVDGFAALVTGDDVERGKPAPDIYLAAAAALQVAPAACLALEDSPHGVRAAKAAGMRCVAVPGPMTAELDFSAADWVFPSLAAVAGELDSLLGPIGQPARSV